MCHSGSLVTDRGRINCYALKAFYLQTNNSPSFISSQSLPLWKIRLYPSNTLKPCGRFLGVWSLNNREVCWDQSSFELLAGPYTVGNAFKKLESRSLESLALCEPSARTHATCLLSVPLWVRYPTRPVSHSVAKLLFFPLPVNTASSQCISNSCVFEQP